MSKLSHGRPVFEHRSLAEAGMCFIMGPSAARMAIRCCCRRRQHAPTTGAGVLWWQDDSDLQ